MAVQPALAQSRERGQILMYAVTGANGNLGRRLLGTELALPWRALVRSARAAGQVEALCGDVRQVDYTDASMLADALAGCRGVVHLVGVLRETAANPYRQAHEGTCRALAEAAGRAGVQTIVYLSILGAEPESPNACLASKGRGERILREGTVPATTLRVPMVLGEGDYASAALAARARRRFNVLLRAGSLEQPIYAGDVVQAVCNVLSLSPGDAAARYDLAGPEWLARAALVHRAAAVLGRRTRVLSVPLGLGMAAAWVLERLTANPPVSRAMLGVLDHDDRIDPAPAAAALGLALTPLDEALRRCLSPR